MLSTIETKPMIYHHIYQQLNQLLPDLTTLEHGQQRFSQHTVPMLYLHVFAKFTDTTFVYLAQCKTQDKQALRNAEDELITLLQISFKVFHRDSMARTLLLKQEDNVQTVNNTAFDPIENHLLNDAGQVILARWLKQGILI